MMPTKDYFNKPRAATYFNDLLINDPDKLFRKYAVHPADSSNNYMVPTDDAALTPMVKALGIASIEAGSVPADKIVAYGNLVKKSRTEALTVKMEGADCLFLDVTNRTDAVGWIPMYYLPWCPAKILNLTIPRRDPTVVTPQPDLFFTAAINGCSIFIQGTAKNPTIYHAGGNPVRAGEGRDSTKVWKQLVNYIKDSGKGSIVAEINKAHHVTEWHMDPTKPRSTQQALDYESFLNTNYKSGSVKITSVSPWGCVFGVRDDQDDWSFYLQENATIYVDTVTGQNTHVEKRRFRKDKVTFSDIVTTQTYGRPMSVRQIWPGGGGAVKMLPPLPIVTNWSKV